MDIFVKLVGDFDIDNPSYKELSNAFNGFHHDIKCYALLSMLSPPPKNNKELIYGH